MIFDGLISCKSATWVCWSESSDSANSSSVSHNCGSKVAKSWLPMGTSWLVLYACRETGLRIICRWMESRKLYPLDSRRSKRLVLQNPMSRLPARLRFLMIRKLVSSVSLCASGLR